MKTKITFAFMFVIIIHKSLFAYTNIISNPGFETVTNPSWYCSNGNYVCPSSGSYTDQVAYWSYVSDWQIPAHEGWPSCLHDYVGSPDLSGPCYPGHTVHTGQYAAFFHGGIQGGDKEAEYIQQNIAPMNQYHYYHVEFWVAGDGANNIGAYFSTNGLTQCAYDIISNTPQIIASNYVGGWTLVSGTLYTEAAYTWACFGNFTNNSSNAFIDDILVYDMGPGPGPCCPPYAIYNNNDNLPSLTQVNQYITAGNTGQVKVLNGQNVTFDAPVFHMGSYFTVNTRGNFHFNAIDCNDATNPSSGGGPIDIISVDNTMSANQQMCATVANASSYQLDIWDEWGTWVYDGAWSVDCGCPVCIWDGSCNRPSCADNFVTGSATYYYTLCFSNCEYTNVCTDGYVYVSGSLGSRLADSLNNPIKQDMNDSLQVYPNPSNGTFTVQINNTLSGMFRFILTDITGRLINEQNNLINGINTIDESSLDAGLYLYKVYSSNNIPIGNGKISIIKQN